MNTPWGKSDFSEKLISGITFYSTPSHGGYKISKKRWDSLHPVYKTVFNNNEQWFEEDCDWCLLYLAFADEIRPIKGDKMIVIAEDTAKSMFPNAYKQYKHGDTEIVSFGHMLASLIGKGKQ
jgi:hypothetical protein